MQHQKRANLPLSLQTTPLTIGTRKVKSESEVDWDMSAKISINRAPDGWRQAYGRHTISELTGRLPHRPWKYVKVPMPMTFQAWIPDPYQWPLFCYHAILNHCSTIFTVPSIIMAIGYLSCRLSRPSAIPWTMQIWAETTMPWLEWW